MSAATIYGIRNCDTMKKARAWLAGQGVDAAFHDYRVSGVDQARLQAWSDLVGWTVLLNRAGTTFRALPEAERADLDRGKAIALMTAHPALIKRPVLDLGGGRLLVGFRPEAYAAALG